MSSRPTPNVPASPGKVRYLTGVAAVMLVFGVSMVVLPRPIETLIGRLFFGDSGFPDAYSDEALSFIRFENGVMGAVMAGWMLLILWVIRSPLAQGVPGAWRTLVLSIAAWFVLDSTVSLIGGLWQNAVGNVVIFVAFAVGLVVTRPRGGALPA